MITPSAPASLSSSVASSGTARQRSKSIHKKEQAPPLPLELNTTTKLSSPLQSRHKKRRRRTRSEDDDEAFFSSDPISAASIRRIGLLLIAGCLLFCWDLRALMGYIEHLEENDNPARGPARMFTQKGHSSSSLRGNHVDAATVVPKNQTIGQR